jgi:hypothetical protein
MLINCFLVLRLWRRAAIAISLLLLLDFFLAFRLCTRGAGVAGRAASPSSFLSRDAFAETYHPNVISRGPCDPSCLTLYFFST